MQRKLKVERIFPLERFGNVHITSELELEDDEDALETYDEMVREVYQAAMNHHDLVKELKLVETVEEKRKILYGEN